MQIIQPFVKGESRVAAKAIVLVVDCNITRMRFTSHAMFLCSVLLLVLAFGAAAEEDAAKSATEDVNATPDEPAKPAFDADHTDWGSYYDPKGEFCGKYDCYKILGFDFEEFGKQHPDRKEITQRYRSLSRAWHPDKSKHRDAKERFVVGSIRQYAFELRASQTLI